MTLRRAFFGNSLSLPVFFALKIASGIALLKIATVYLSVVDLTAFFQFLLLGALVNMVTVGGVQNGFVRLIAKSNNGESERSAIKAALTIWLSTLVAVCFPLIIFRDAVSILLIESTRGSWSVIWITLATFLAGPGIIICGVLTGKGKVPASLFAQGVGLFVGSAACIILLVKGEPLAAAIAFYAGSLATFPVAWLLGPRNPTILLKNIAGYHNDIVTLLKYSGAFIFIATFTSLSLFGMRYVYQSVFDAEALGYWMVAQRVSDTSMQFLGLFMVQMLIPQYASSESPPEKAKIVQRSWLTVTAILAIFLGAFALAPELIVRIFLSEKYLPAISLIMIYMLGDIFRGTVSLTMHTAFADGKLIRYIGIEVFVMILFAVIMLALVSVGNRQAPIFGYTAAYGAGFLIIALWSIAKKLIGSVQT